MLPRSLLAGLVAGGLLLSATVVPGVFIIDDDNYLINALLLRHGRVTVGNTEGLSPSNELLFFDPGPWKRVVASTPVASTAPPLYGVLAMPAVWAGWRALVGLNTLAYLLTTALVFAYARHHARDALTPWIAAAAFAIGGYAIEYAQGLWPQALSFAFTTAGIALAGRVVDGGSPRAAVGAGFLIAVATGLRYQNAVILGAAGVAVVLWSGRRIASAGAFAAGASVPLALCAALNHARLGSWNPISKGPEYLDVPLFGNTHTSLLDPLVMLWARVVDFSWRPPLQGPLFKWVTYDAATGAHLMSGVTAQKSFLQSAPWAVLAIAVFALAWVPGSTLVSAGQRRQLRLLSLISAAVVMVFAVSGVHRHEGLAYNQRYMLELLPLAAVALAWAVDGLAVKPQLLAAGTLWGALVAALIVLAVPPGSIRVIALLKVPLVLAAATLAAWLGARSRPAARTAVAVGAGACIGWAVVVHVGEDVMAAQLRRTASLAQTRALAAAIPDGAAVVCYWGNRDAVVPLLFDRDIVILDVKADEGRAAPGLIHELLARKRRVFVNQPGFPADVVARVVAGRQVVAAPHPGTALIELR